MSFSICRRTPRKSRVLSRQTGNLPWGLFARATINFSVFTRVMISLSAIYYKCVSCYLLLAYLCLKYAVIESIWKIFVIIYDYLPKDDMPMTCSATCSVYDIQWNMYSLKSWEQSSLSMWPAMRVDSCYIEFIRTKNYALNNFWWNFTEMLMKVNKVIPENLVAVR